VTPFRVGIRKCSAEEREIIEEAAKRVTLRRLAWVSGGLPLSRLRAVYGLLASGVIEQADAKEGAQPIIQMETSTFLLSAEGGRPRGAKSSARSWTRSSRARPT
jgi:hypothetical protein